MNEVEKNLSDGHLTQKEIIQLLLHNAQHMATREEVKADIKELKSELREDNKELKEDLLRIETSLQKGTFKVEVSLTDKIEKVEASLTDEIARVETSLTDKIGKVETSLKEDTKNLSKRLDRFMFWTLGLVTTSTFLILGFMYKWIVK